MKLSEKIYEQRKRLNLSQEALSDKLEVSRQSVSKWESEQATPELEKLIQMAQLFGISLDELITDKISESKNITHVNDNQKTHTSVQKESKKNKARFIVEALIILVVGFLAYSMFEKINTLEQELGYVKQNYQNYVQLYETNLSHFMDIVQDKIISASELLTDYTSEIDTIDMQDKVITYRIQFMAKDETNLNSIDFSALPKSGDPITLTATSVGNGIYSVLLPIDMNQESYLVTARFNTTQGAKNQSLGTFSGYDLIHPNISIYVDGWTIEGTQNQLTLNSLNVDVQNLAFYNGQMLLQGSMKLQIHDEAMVLTSESPLDLKSRVEPIESVGLETYASASFPFTLLNKHVVLALNKTYTFSLLYTEADKTETTFTLGTVKFNGSGGNVTEILRTGQVY